jgi:phage pi2 protein 07
MIINNIHRHIHLIIDKINVDFYHQLKEQKKINWKLKDLNQCSKKRKRKFIQITTNQ